MAIRISARLVAGLFALAIITASVANAQKSCICITLYDPVCGSDCVTYSNSCYASCARVGSTTPGPCPDTCTPKQCKKRGALCVVGSDQCCGSQVCQADANGNGICTPRGNGRRLMGS